MLSKKIIKELNTQVNREFQSAYKYLGMSVYCDAEGLEGCAKWLRIQAQEEIEHGMKIYRYLSDMNAEVTMSAVPEPRTNFSSLIEVFEKAVEAETQITKDLAQIAELAMQENDVMTRTFLDWFLQEQVEEIALTNNVLSKVKLVGKSGEGLLVLDKELGARVAEQG